MKVLNLTQASRMYTSNVYMVLGTWNSMEDFNTLVDVGRDPLVIEKIEEASTGVGKRRVEQVVLTHSHYDHTTLLPRIREVFNPEVHAFSPFLKGVDHVLTDGEKLKLGDRMFEVIHIPGHSSDSLCLYCEKEGILFSGDAQLVIQSIGGSYEKGFVHALERLCHRDIRTIYPGHGNAFVKDCNRLIRTTLKYVKQNTLDG